MTPFDLFSAPLHGVALIEAGAGTGKTYALTGIFLRLIVEKGLRIDQILAVTYTKAATEEIKTRIRKRLITAKRAFNGDHCDDQLLSYMVQESKDEGEALQRIEDALTDFDRAAIFTIHGFCRRLLQYFAFETGQLFQSELVQDNRTLIQELVQDFWRLHITSAPYEFAHFALNKLKGPNGLVKVLQYCAYPHVRVLPEVKKIPLRSISPWRKEAEELHRIWAQYKGQAINCLLDPVLHARFYGKCEPEPDSPPWTHRQIRLAQLASGFDEWNGRYPLDDKSLKYFRSSLIKKYTKKGKQSPEHPFFDACERTFTAQEMMAVQMNHYLRYLKTKLHHNARLIMDQKKRRDQLMFFDDLLVHLHSALTGKQGQTLAVAVRSQYKAALVDEFQDTDPLQYEIFQQLFDNPNQTLVMIGDPKQAIYSFRGADLFSYLKAVDDTQNRSTLTLNWRSTPQLIKAVNTFFENHKYPFGFKKIAFNPAQAALKDNNQKKIPLKLWYLTDTEDQAPSKPINQTNATQAISLAVAEEIVKLINNPDEKIESRQIAVLTRKHSQSQIIKNALAQKHVPAVLYSAGSVFHTNEAACIIRIMTSLIDPSHTGNAHAVFAGDFFGLNAHQLHQGMEFQDAKWQKRRMSLYHDNQTWLNYGFYAMFQNLMTREKVKSKLLTLPDGERCITNILHLVELLHEAECTNRFSPEGLLKWFITQQQSEEENQEKQLRLESDAKAIRIITMHKSKGLQFDVVFCPFTWSGVSTSSEAAVFHDQQHGNRLSLSLGPDIPPEYTMAARNELMAENLRMLYVALTRAKKRCYMVWGRINKTELSAPAYLIHSSQKSMDDADWASALECKMKSLTDAEMIKELNHFAKRSENCIAVEAIPKPTKNNYKYSAASEEVHSCRILKRNIVNNWHMASFSSLTTGKQNEHDNLYDLDHLTTITDDAHVQTEKTDTLFHFPKGAHAGNFFHDVLEHWDHSSQDGNQHKALIQEKLKRHGFELSWLEGVHTLLKHLSAKNLKTENGTISFSRISSTHRINEMEFYYPLKQFLSIQMKKCFERHPESDLDNKEIVKRFERLTFTAQQGFMKGFIDAIFYDEHKQQYYIVDWKSNHLGYEFDDYQPEQLKQIMVANDYFLQYHLYIVALNRWLRQKHSGYDYNSHFGGVFYIFIRGITSDSVDNTGVYHSKPAQPLVESLDQVIVPEYS